LYHISSNFYSLVYIDEDIKGDVKTHCISYGRCNFRCAYCAFKFRDDYVKYNPEILVRKFEILASRSLYFKFTGGEPLLNPDIYEDLKAVKKLGGVVFLDTNGSMPYIAENIFKNKLADIMGISIKGLNAEEALKKTCISNKTLCWDNPFKTLDIAQKYGIKTIATMIFDASRPLEQLYDFAELIKPYKNIRLKVNNLLPGPQQGGEAYQARDREELLNALKEFVINNPEWKNRTTLINGQDAVTDTGCVVYL